MTRNSSGSHGGSHRSHRRSSDDRRSSSKHSRSSFSRHSANKSRSSVGEETARSTKSRSTRSSRSKSGGDQPYTGTYGNGKDKKRLIFYSDGDDEIAGSTQSWTQKYGSKLGIAAFVVGVIIAVVTTYLWMKNSGKSSKEINNNSNPTIAPTVQVGPTMDPTVAPTGMPTVEYPPPGLAVCQALKEGQGITAAAANRDTLLPRNMDISFDVTIRPGGPFRTEEAVFEYFPEKLESVLVPILAGCEDVPGFHHRNLESSSQRELYDDALEQIRYVIAGGAVSGTKYNEISCPENTSGQLLSCFNVIVYFEFLLKGDERVFQVLSLISNILADMTSTSIATSGSDLSSSLVNSLGLPNPPFQKVVVNGVTNNDPTVSPSVSPTQFPTDKPSLAPSLGPTNRPSVSPTVSPSYKPSSSPTGRPSVSPTKGPTRSPTRQPSKSPTETPSADPTGKPSQAPTMAPSVSPSLAPSTVPSLSNAPSVSGAPSGVPSISNAPTSRIGHIIGLLPPTWNDGFVIDWLANIDTWWSDAAEDEAPYWMERYALVLFSKELGGFAQSGNSVCGWWNITCDANGRVTEVELPYNEMTGGIPSELSAFSQMTKLDLSHNTYTGTTIPTELFALVKMEYLDISSSGIDGTIPTQIANLLNLREMHLNSNNLVGTIPRLPELVQRPQDAVISLGNGVTVASVCEMYGNALETGDVSSANAGGCDLVRTASDSSSSSSSSDDNSTPSSAPVTRFRYRTLFRRRDRALEEEEESSEDEELESLRKRMEKFRSPVYNLVGVRAPNAEHHHKKKKRRISKKSIKHVAMKKHAKKRNRLPIADAEEFHAEFQMAEQLLRNSKIPFEEEEAQQEFDKSEFSDEEE